MTKPFRPLLAATIDNDAQLDALNYPMIASPKVDGIRIVCHPTLGPVTRSLKPVRNEHIRNKLCDSLMWGLDGEIVSGPIAATDVFNRTTTAVMTQSGTPKFTYWVFDTMSLDLGYVERLNSIQMRVIECKQQLTQSVDIQELPYAWVNKPEGVLEAEIDWLAQGFEGVMLRHPLGPYKWGRSTLKEQTLLKLKRFTDAEAIIIGFEPLYSNQNPQTRNSQGLAERSDHKAGKVQVEVLGNLLVRSEREGFDQFSIGSGFDQALRTEIWNNRNKYLGRTITFKYQKIGVVEKPRFPIFLRFRESE